MIPHLVRDFRLDTTKIADQVIVGSWRKETGVVDGKMDVAQPTQPAKQKQDVV
jgi:hypothetical protein